jgi:hypothetical protein
MTYALGCNGVYHPHFCFGYASLAREQAIPMTYSLQTKRETERERLFHRKKTLLSPSSLSIPGIERRKH